MFSLASVNPFEALAGAFLRERARWGLWAPLAVAVGIVFYFNLPREPSYFCLLVPVGLAWLAWLVKDKNWPAAVFLFVLTLAATGFAAAKIEMALSYSPMLKDIYGPAEIEGRVATTDIMPEGVRLKLTHLRVEGNEIALPDSVRVRFKGVPFLESPPAGSLITFSGQLMPFAEPAAPQAADFRRMAFFNGLGGMGWSLHAPKIISSDASALPWDEKLALFFEQGRKILARHAFENLHGDVAAMVAARLNGEQSAISTEVTNAMRIAGLTHLLATSGYNVTMMGLLIYFPIRALLALIPWIALRWPIKKIAAIGALLSAGGYTFLVGSPAATLRSLIMAVLVLIMVLSDRRSTPLRLVMVSAMLCLLVAPDSLLGASFQLSFGAVLCLVAANGFNLGERDEEAPVETGLIGKTVAHFREILTSSLVATAATTPICLYHFQSFSLYGFISNMAALPLTSFWVMPMILIAYVLAPFGLDGFFLRMAGLGDQATIAIAQTVSSWPHAIFYWPAMPAGVYAVMIGGGLWLCLWKHKWRYAGLLPIVIGMLYPLYTTQPDLLISADGQLWGTRLENGRMIAAGDETDHFDAKQWRQRWGNPPIIAIENLAPEQKEIACDDEGCVLRHGGVIIALPQKAATAWEDCSHADIVISPAVLRDCAARIVIDGKDFAQRGAHSVTVVKGDIALETARQTRGGRPWSAGYQP